MQLHEQSNLTICMLRCPCHWDNLVGEKKKGISKNSSKVALQFFKSEKSLLVGVHKTQQINSSALALSLVEIHMVPIHLSQILEYFSEYVSLYA